jgi:hypothetical protein
MRQNVKIASAVIPKEKTDGLPAFETSLITVARGDGARNFNVQPSCTDAKGLIDRCVESCLSNEKAARETLSDNCAAYSAGDKNHSVSPVSNGGPPSYVEFLVCLQMSLYARGLTQDRARPIKPRRHR